MRTVWSASHQFLISEILTLGQHLAVWNLVRACWKKMVLTLCDKCYFCARNGARPINYWFPRFWLSLIISLFENLWEHVESWWLSLAVISTICAHGVWHLIYIADLRDFCSGWYSHSLKTFQSMLKEDGSYSHWRVVLVRTVWSASHQFLISAILTLGHKLTLLKLVRACWKLVGFTICDQYKLCARWQASHIYCCFQIFWLWVIFSLFENL